MTNLIQYARSATDDSQLLAAQLAEGKQWAGANGHVVIVQFSEVLSGLADHSPLWLQAVRMAMDIGAGILVRDLARISRNPLKLQMRLNTLKALGIELLVMQDAT